MKVKKSRRYRDSTRPKEQPSSDAFWLSMAFQTDYPEKAKTVCAAHECEVLTYHQLSIASKKIGFFMFNKHVADIYAF